GGSGGQAGVNVRHKLFRHVDGNATPVRATVEHITLMLFAGPARRAIPADAPATTKAQRTQKRRPETRRFASQPARNIRRRFRINMLHMKNVILCTCTAQEKTCAKIAR